MRCEFQIDTGSHSVNRSYCSSLWRRRKERRPRNFAPPPPPNPDQKEALRPSISLSFSPFWGRRRGGRTKEQTSTPFFSTFLYVCALFFTHCTFVEREKNIQQRTNTQVCVSLLLFAFRKRKFFTDLHCNTKRRRGEK